MLIHEGIYFSLLYFNIFLNIRVCLKLLYKSQTSFQDFVITKKKKSNALRFLEYVQLQQNLFCKIYFGFSDYVSLCFCILIIVHKIFNLVYILVNINKFKSINGLILPKSTYRSLYIYDKISKINIGCTERKLHSNL